MGHAEPVVQAALVEEGDIVNVPGAPVVALEACQVSVDCLCGWAKAS
jgi:hypothetical protein